MYSYGRKQCKLDHQGHPGAIHIEKRKNILGRRLCYECTSRERELLDKGRDKVLQNIRFRAEMSDR